MRVVVGLRALHPGKIGGMETYVRALLADWAARRRDDEWVVLVNDSAAPTFSSPGPWMRFVNAGPAGDLRRWRAELERQPPSVFFSPLLTIDPVDPAMPAVVNMPDLQHEAYPGNFAREILAFRRLHFPLSARRASAVLTLSEHAKRMIVDRIGVPGEKVHAIPLAADDAFRRAESPERISEFRRRRGLPDRYIFYPANFWPHKNHAALFAALARIGRSGRPIPPLVLTGFAGADDERLERSIRDNGVGASVTKLGYLERNELPLLYRAAEFLVFPSLFEGFGLPVAEAFASGCPVLCANATSLPELAGDAARYFDPRDPGDLAERILALWNDPAARARLRGRGLSRAGEFDWRVTADRTYRVLARVADSLSSAPSATAVAVAIGRDNRINPAELSLADAPVILHFLRPGSRPAPESPARAAALFRERGVAALVGSVGSPGEGAAGRAAFDTLRLKSEHYLPLEALWIGPGLAPEIIEWLRSDPGVTPYQIFLRVAVSGVVADAPELRVFSEAPGPGHIGALVGTRLSERYFGIPDRGWLIAIGESAVRRIPLLGRLLGKRHRTRGLLVRMIVGVLHWRQTGEFPRGWRSLFPDPAGTVAAVDGWVSRRGLIGFDRAADSQLRFALDSPVWPFAKPPRVRVRHGRSVLLDCRLSRRGRYHYALPWPSGPASRVELVIECDRVFVPAHHGLGDDHRSLSIRVLKD